jgi:hypothetical protein
MKSKLHRRIAEIRIGKRHRRSKARHRHVSASVSGMERAGCSTIALKANLAGTTALTVDENRRPRFRQAWDTASPSEPSRKEALSGRADAEGAPSADMAGIRRRTA